MKYIVTFAIIVIAVVVVDEIRDINPGFNVACEKAGGQQMPVAGSDYSHSTSNTVCVSKSHSPS